MPALPLLLALLVSPPQTRQAEAEKLFTEATGAQQRGDFALAIRDYESLLRLDPRQPDVRVNLGAALAHTGQFDNAIAQYRVALQSMPGNAEVRTDLGLAYYKKNNFADAARELDEAHRLSPHSAQIATLLGDSEVKLGKAAEAVAMLTPLESDNAGNGDFEFVLGEALVAAGQPRAGAERLQKVADATGAADTCYLAGSTWLNLNEAALARKDLEVAAQANPQLPRVQILLGMARDHAGDQPQAEIAFREGIKRSPDDFDANLYLGTLLLNSRDLPAAKPFLDRALKAQPASTLAQYESARWKSISGQYADAITELEAVVKAQPEWLEPHVELATVYYKLHRPEDGARERAIVAKLTEAQQERGPGK